MIVDLIESDYCFHLKTVKWTWWYLGISSRNRIFSLEYNNNECTYSKSWRLQEESLILLHQLGERLQVTEKQYSDENCFYRNLEIAPLAKHHIVFFTTL